MIESPEVISAIITATGAVVATIIASIAAAIIGKKVVDRERLQSDLNRAIQDVHFLLEVEKRHCEMHAEQGGNSSFRAVRAHVKNNRNESWSGRFTPGREGRHVKT